MEVTTEASFMGSIGHQNKPYGHEIVNLKKKRSRSYHVTETKRKEANHIMSQKEKDRKSKRVEVDQEIDEESNMEKPSQKTQDLGDSASHNPRIGNDCNGFS